MGPLLLIMNSVLNTTWDRDSLRKGIKRPLNIKDQPTYFETYLKYYIVYKDTFRRNYFKGF